MHHSACGRSPIVSILMTVVVWLFLFVVGIVHQFIDGQRQFEQKPEAALIDPIGDKWWAKAIDVVYRRRDGQYGLLQPRLG